MLNKKAFEKKLISMIKTISVIMRTTTTTTTTAAVAATKILHSYCPVR